MTVTKAGNLWVFQLALGPMKNFVYLAGHPESREVVVVDPAWDVPAIVAAVEAHDKVLSGIVVSHHHGDHIGGVAELLSAHDVPVWVQGEEFDFAPSVRQWPGATRRVGPGQTVKVGKLDMTFVHTPGHTPGSQCLSCGGALFSGDTVFVNACGRCDLGGGDASALWKSLHHVLGALPDDTRLFPGHDYGDVAQSSLGRERAHNPYFLLPDLNDFVAHRTRPR